MPDITEDTMREALEMLRRYYDQVDGSRVYPELGMTPSQAVTLFMKAPDVLRQLARTVETCAPAEAPPPAPGPR